MKYNYNYIRKKEDADNWAHLEKDYMKQSLQVIHVENGTILSRKESNGSTVWMGLGGVLTSDNKFVEISGILNPAKVNGELAFGGSYEYSEPVEVIDEEVLYMGPFQPHWGHFLLEYCTRLWYWIKNKPNIRIVYCGFYCKPGEIGGNFMEFLSYLDIKKEQLLDIRKPTKFKKIIVPEQSFLRNRYVTKEYKELIDYARRNALKDLDLPIYDKIYFTRTLFKNALNKERGEEEIRDILESNGYKCFAPENLSAKEQMYYVYNCKEFVAIVGGASMNAVFADDNTRRIYIKKAFEPIVGGDLYQLDEVTNASEATFIDCYYKPYKDLPQSYGGGPHLLGVTGELRRYLKDHKMKRGNLLLQRIALVKNFIWLTRLRKKVVTKTKK